jgi:hypothetical protein
MTPEWFERLAGQCMDAADYSHIMAPSMEAKFIVAADNALEMAIRENNAAIYEVGHE